MEDGCPLFQHYSFFGYNADTSTVRILLTGKSPADEDTLGGNVHRNVINTQYCAAIVCPIIKEKFPRVRDVECLLSGDPEFGDAVRAKGGGSNIPTFGIMPLNGTNRCGIMAESIRIFRDVSKLLSIKVVVLLIILR